MFHRDAKIILMRPVILACLIMTAVTTSVAAAEPNPPSAPTFYATKTGKERLSDKASDEQRVDDCKVPQVRRTRTRPTDCRWNAGS